MKKSLFGLTAFVLLLTGCATDGSMNTATNTTEQLGMTALKIAVNNKCMNEINTIPAWQTASKLMTDDQKQDIQTEICGCVSEKAPQNVTAVDLATAAIDPAARATIVSNAVSRTINACVAEAVR